MASVKSCVKKCLAGDTAIYFFRPQVFNTGSGNIARVSGMSENAPDVEAVYDKANPFASI